VVVAIDGPSGVGKSTVARGVAKRLGLPYLDTGAYYRAATLAVQSAGVDPGDGAAVYRAVTTSVIDFVDGHIELDGRDVRTDIRSDTVTADVSEVSAHPDVRTAIVNLQRSWVGHHGGAAVVEGRDIGTVVFPHAPVKAFLTARPEVRAARRAGDVEAAGRPVIRIASELAARDRADSTRAASPLTPAADAVVIDTSDWDADGVIAAVLRLVEDVTPQPL